MRENIAKRQRIIIYHIR